MKHLALFLALFLALPASLHADDVIFQQIFRSWRSTTDRPLDATLRLTPDVYPGNRFIFMYVGQTIIFDRQLFRADGNNNISCVTADYFACDSLWRGNSFFLADDNGNPTGNPLPEAPFKGPNVSGGLANEYIRFSIGSKEHPEAWWLFGIQARKPGLIVWQTQAIDYTLEKTRPDSLTYWIGDFPLPFIHEQYEFYRSYSRIYTRTICILPYNPGFPYAAPGVFYPTSSRTLPTVSGSNTQTISPGVFYALPDLSVPNSPLADPEGTNPFLSPNTRNRQVTHGNNYIMLSGELKEITQ
jgi:hypothetical protein